MKKKFAVRSIDQIKEDIDTAFTQYGDNVRRVFFLDGNAMTAPAETLLEATKYANQKFPRLQRLSVYAHVNDILKKTDDQLAELAEAGLKMAYIGIETGDNDLLKKITKHQTADKIVEAFAKCFKAGITPSGTIILGLAGSDKELSTRHMKRSAELVNRCSPVNFIKEGNLPPWYISALTLMTPPGTKIEKDAMDGKFNPLTVQEVLYEMKVFFENISPDVKKCIFRSNHASNYLPLKGTLSRDTDKLLETINKALKGTAPIQPESYRGL